MTLFTLEKNKKKLRHVVILYIVITAFIALFGAVYEQYSHNVHTPYMWFAWVWVLGFGLVPHLLLFFFPIKYIPGLVSGCLYNFGVAMITCRSLYIGVVTISNTPDNRWMLAYLIVAIVFLTAGVVSYGFGIFFEKKKPQIEEDDD